MKSLIALMTLALGLGLTACVETTHQTCTDDRLVDVPGLDGAHSVSIISQDFELQSLELQIARIGKGQYRAQNRTQNQDAEVMRACRVGSHYIVESKTKYGTYQMNVVNPSAKGFSLSIFVAGVKDLMAAGIPYQIVERDMEEKTQNRLSAWGMNFSGGPKTKVLVIDNSTPAAQSEIESKGRPLSVGFIYQ